MKKGERYIQKSDKNFRMACGAANPGSSPGEGIIKIIQSFYTQKERNIFLFSKLLKFSKKVV